MSEEEKAIKWLKDNSYNLSGKELHYSLILFGLINNLQKENQELKNQQKEFIDYLENKIILFQEYMKEFECSDRCHGDYPITYYIVQYKLEETIKQLLKYKEIVGG